MRVVNTGPPGSSVIQSLGVAWICVLCRANGDGTFLFINRRPLTLRQAGQTAHWQPPMRMHGSLAAENTNGSESDSADFALAEHGGTASG